MIKLANLMIIKVYNDVVCDLEIGCMQFDIMMVIYCMIC